VTHLSWLITPLWVGGVLLIVFSWAADVPPPSGRLGIYICAAGTLLSLFFDPDTGKSDQPREN
jgi:hypothetical protein